MTLRDTPGSDALRVLMVIVMSILAAPCWWRFSSGGPSFNARFCMSQRMAALHREGGLVEAETRHQSFQGVVAMFTPVGAITVSSGIAVRADARDDRRTRAEHERAMDQVLADSFPASDPPPWTLGVAQRHPEPNGIVRVSRSPTDRVPEGRPLPWVAITDVVIVGGGSAAQRTMNQLRATVAGSIGVALLFPIAILTIGLPIVLALRGIAEAVAWLAALMLK